MHILASRLQTETVTAAARLFQRPAGRTVAYVGLDWPG